MKHHSLRYMCWLIPFWIGKNCDTNKINLLLYMFRTWGTGSSDSTVTRLQFECLKNRVSFTGWKRFIASSKRPNWFAGSPSFLSIGYQCLFTWGSNGRSMWLTTYPPIMNEWRYSCTSPPTFWYAQEHFTFIHCNRWECECNNYDWAVSSTE